MSGVCLIKTFMMIIFFLAFIFPKRIKSGQFENFELNDIQDGQLVEADRKPECTKVDAASTIIRKSLFQGV